MQTDSASSDTENAVISKVTRHLFPFMILLTMVNFLDRTNIGLAALTMNKDLGIDPATFGFAAGIFFLGYILFEVPSNIILHRVGANIWLARIMFTWGLVSMGMAFVHGATGLYVMRFLLGVAEAGFIPGMTLYILLWIPLRQRARITAYWILATPFAGIVGGPLGGLLLQLDGVLGFKGWQWLFIAEGLPAIILAVATYFYLTPTPAKAQWLDEDERQWLQRTLAAEDEKIHAETRQKFTHRRSAAELARAGAGPALYRHEHGPAGHQQLDADHHQVARHDVQSRSARALRRSRGFAARWRRCCGAGIRIGRTSGTSISPFR